MKIDSYKTKCKKFLWQLLKTMNIFKTNAFIIIKALLLPKILKKVKSYDDKIYGLNGMLNHLKENSNKMRQKYFYSRDKKFVCILKLKFNPCY